MLHANSQRSPARRKDRAARNLVEIEDIQEMRRREGIEDDELATEIQNLRAGSFVRLTLLFDTKAAETVLVRITSIRGKNFRGKLADDPAAQGLAELHAGAPVAFTAANIHSIPRSPPHA